MDPLSLHLWTCDVGADAGGAAGFAEMIVGRVSQSWADGADLVVFPEFAWLGAERYMEGPDPVIAVAEWFWETIWPGLRSGLAKPGKAVVLGTVPFVSGDGRLFNRAPILAGDNVFYQDKLHLTPWESAFTPGDVLRIWEFRGLRLATVVCLDIEIPELAVALRAAEVDAILVPSATDGVLGSERVCRCADARAAELACQVAVCPLVGRAGSALVDMNLGRFACYSPSQSPFAGCDRRISGDMLTSGFHRMEITLDPSRVRACRALREETVPARLRPETVRLEPEPNRSL
ncbi:MAG: hypothetical protein J0M04_11065 [Verrucomicrobia bacterium]|nr:hypothetical protein [Verrucomicrobiota bacterium]